MKKILMSLLLSIAALLLPAGPVVDGNGNLQIGKLALRWTCYAPDWSAAVLGNDSFKAAPGFPRYNSGEFETAGTWNGFRFTVTAAAVKEDTITYSARFKANPPVETRTLALVMNLPADTPAPGVLVDGRKIELPATFERIQLFGSRKVHCLQFELDRHHRRRLHAADPGRPQVAQQPFRVPSRSRSRFGHTQGGVAGPAAPGRVAPHRRGRPQTGLQYGIPR